MLSEQAQLLTCYYFHGQDFCMVPRHVRADMQWMADHAVEAIAIAVHEGDLYGSNLPLVCEEAQKQNLKVIAVPSRLAGLTAGWHRAPGYISALHPELWARHADGSPVDSYGAQCSLHHPDLLGHLTDYLDLMLKELPVDGVIWDEIKTLHREDHSDHALKALGHPARVPDQIKATVDVFGQMNAHLLSRKPDLRIDAFIPASMPDQALQPVAGIHGLNSFGCDGKCWPADTCGVGEGGFTKYLIGNIERFRSAAQTHGRNLLVLLELQMLDKPALDFTCHYLQDMLAYEPEHLIYYYYPRLMAESDHYMPRLGQAIAQWHQSRQRQPSTLAL